jgi:hypothetical protein
MKRSPAAPKTAGLLGSGYAKKRVSGYLRVVFIFLSLIFLSASSRRWTEKCWTENILNHGLCDSVIRIRLVCRVYVLDSSDLGLTR